MVANLKPVPWNEIKKRWESGETAASIARELTEKGNKISKQAISQKAKREGWKPPTAATKRIREHEERWKEARQQTTTLATTADNSPDKPSIKQSRQIAQWGKRTPENRDTILASLRSYGNKTLAAASAGIDRTTLRNWSKDDDLFAAEIEEAQAQWAHDRLQNVHNAGDRGDWKADQWLLGQHMPDQYSQNEAGGKGGGINIQFNFSRSTEAPDPGEIITVKPTDIEQA